MGVEKRGRKAPLTLKFDDFLLTS